MADSGTNGASAGVTRLETRAWTAVMGISLLLGGWWLQNQHDTTLRMQEQMATLIRHVDDKYVQKDYLEVLAERLVRIEDKLDAAIARERMREDAKPPSRKF